MTAHTRGRRRTRSALRRQGVRHGAERLILIRRHGGRRYCGNPDHSKTADTVRPTRPEAETDRHGEKQCVEDVRTSEGSGNFFEAFGYPHLYDGLPRNPETPGLTIQRPHHPQRKIDIDPLLAPLRSGCAGQIEQFRNIFAVIEFPVKFVRFHNSLSLQVGNTLRI